MLIRGEYVNMDGWLNGVLDFDYNPDGILDSAKFTGEDGFDAEIKFSYDMNFNLVKIHWDFTTGQTQTYFYTYESN